ncbi:MAG: metallophosphoesterase [Elusimicrobia bacterium]|nr:metallophosphoesterase [Elusimicrobiota bacterium]
MMRVRLMAALLFLAPAAWAGPEAGDAGLRFVVLSDSRGRDYGVNDAALALLVDHIKKDSGAEFVAFPGDMVYGGKVSAGKTREQLVHWRGVMEPLYASPGLVGLKVYPGIGNHEVWVPGGDKAFLEVFPELPANGPEGEKGLTYSFDFRGVHFVMLDTAGGHADGEKGVRGLPLDWLRADLNAARERGAKRFFAFGHDPAFPVGPGHIGDSLPRLGRKRLFRDLDPSGLKARDAFWDLLRENRVTAYVCGHEHLNAVESVRGVAQVVAGAAGAPLSSFNPCVDEDGEVPEQDRRGYKKTLPYYKALGYPHGKGGNCQASPDFWGGRFFGYALFEVSDAGVSVSFWGVEPKPGSKTEALDGASVRLMHRRRLR